MPRLILDLDLTVFARMQDSSLVHRTHTFSDPIITSLDKKEATVRIINPDELSELVTVACETYEGIIILTSGLWDKEVLKALTNHLDISEKVAKKFCDAYFISSGDCLPHFPNLNLEQMLRLDKNLRFDKFLERTPELKNEYFVFIDDNYQHIYSFRDHSKVTAVHAPTFADGKAFYKTALDELKNAADKQSSVELNTDRQDENLSGSEKANQAVCSSENKEANLKQQTLTGVKQAFFSKDNNEMVMSQENAQTNEPSIMTQGSSSV